MELMDKNLVLFDVEASSKEEVIGLITDAMDKGGRLLDKEGYRADVLKREASSTTAVGFSVATPHAKSVHVKEPSLAFLRLKAPIQWDDDEEVQMVFQIGVPSPGQGDRHLEILAQLFRHLVHEEFQEKLRTVSSPEELIALVGAV